MENAGCSDLSQLNAGIVSPALLTFSNKDAYARIRQFLGYLAEKGIMEVDLSRIVPHYKRGMVLSTTYTPDEISRVEVSVDTNTTIGKRNLAIIRLASRMGLRAGDIAKLKLSEINFSTGYISITQEKTGIPLTLQMPCEVVNAISMHLDNDKYSLEDGYVFHSLTAPYGRITTGIIQHTLNECFAAANVNTAGKKHGPHAFRSSLASSMVNDDASYEVVRRILGHSNPDVIKHYAKADIENLRMCSIDPPIPTGKIIVIRQFLEFPVILRLLYSYGLRIGETVKISMNDVDLDGGILCLINTKGNKQRLVPMSVSAHDRYPIQVLHGNEPYRQEQHMAFPIR